MGVSRVTLMDSRAATLTSLFSTVIVSDSPFWAIDFPRYHRAAVLSRWASSGGAYREWNSERQRLPDDRVLPVRRYRGEYTGGCVSDTQRILSDGSSVDKLPIKSQPPQQLVRRIPNGKLRHQSRKANAGCEAPPACSLSDGEC